MLAPPAHPSRPPCRAGCVACLSLAWTGCLMADDGLSGHAAAALGQMQRNPDAVAGAPITLRAETYPGLDGPVAPRPQWHSPPPGAVRYVDITGWLTPRQASSLGLTLGLVSDGMDRSAGAAPAAYDLGVRWRSRLDRDVRIDVQAWARTQQNAPVPDAMGMIWHREPSAYGTRLEVQWTTSRTGGLVPEFGAIGVQMQGDSRLLLRTRRGGPMLYYRTKF